MKIRISSTATKEGIINSDTVEKIMQDHESYSITRNRVILVKGITKKHHKIIDPLVEMMLEKSASFTAEVFNSDIPFERCLDYKISNWDIASGTGKQPKIKG